MDQTQYDLLSVIMICLRKKKDSAKTENELLKMLSTLLDLDNKPPHTRDFSRELGGYS